MLKQVYYENGSWQITNVLGNANKELKNGNKSIAYYEPVTNTTYTSVGKAIGKGNLLIDIAEGKIQVKSRL